MKEAGLTGCGPYDSIYMTFSEDHSAVGSGEAGGTAWGQHLGVWGDGAVCTPIVAVVTCVTTQRTYTAKFKRSV